MPNTMVEKIQDAREYEFLWNNNGHTSDGGRVKLEDALSVPDASMLMPKVISNIVKEAVEPLLVGTQLLTRINYTYGQTISFPAVGAMQAADIAEGQEYPERNLQMGGATVTASIGKSGLAVKITDEMIRYSQFDVIGMHLRAAGRALARHKEAKIFKYIKAMGVVVFDNLTPSGSLLGVTTGRDIAGAGNGSVTADDIFDCYAQVIMNGFFPDTLLVHPLTWSMFAKDATLRHFVLNGGGGGGFIAGWSGNPAGRAPWDASSQGGLGVSGGQQNVPGGAQSGEAASALSEHPQTLNSAPQLPGYFNIPFRIIVSPLVPYDPVRKLSDVYMFDSSELGVLIVDEDVTTEEFDDPRVDIKKIKLRERYGIGILNEGKGIAVMKNVHVVANQVVLPAQTVINDIAVIPPGTPVV